MGDAPHACRKSRKTSQCGVCGVHGSATPAPKRQEEGGNARGANRPSPNPAWAPHEEKKRKRSRLFLQKKLEKSRKWQGAHTEKKCFTMSQGECAGPLRCARTPPGCRFLSLRALVLVLLPRAAVFLRATRVNGSGAGQTGRDGGLPPCATPLLPPSRFFLLFFSSPAFPPVFCAKMRKPRARRRGGRDRGWRRGLGMDATLSPLCAPPSSLSLAFVFLVTWIDVS